MCSYPCCSKKPTRIVITDFCPGGTYYSSGQPSFDLSGAAISKMALPGKDGEMRGIGLYNIQYKRVPCRYPRKSIAFKVDTGSSGFWFAFTVKYVGGSGDIGSVAIRQVHSFVCLVRPLQFRTDFSLKKASSVHIFLSTCFEAKYSLTTSSNPTLK